VVFGGSGSDPRCIPVASTESACDGKDDDCNGLIDDVDPGHDGLCDCVKIAILGKAGTYESSNFQQWLTTRGTTVLRMQEEGKPALTKASLANFDMVILDWLQRDYGPSEIAEFDEWLQQGHGVLALSGYSDTYPASRPNGFLARVGFALSPSTSIPGRQVVHQFLPHPLTEGLSAISFYGGSEVSLAGKVSPDAKRTAFASFEDKVVGGVYEMPNHGARAVVWGDEWVEFDSEWSALPEIARFWSNIVSFLAPKCQLPPHPIR
jgi:hypothetical protein